MSPVKDLSNITRLNRLGKIHLGYKVEVVGKPGQTRPKATDYFVCPPEIAEVYGPEPRELDIMFPSEDADQFASLWLKRYSQTQGLVCKGDGETSTRKVDALTGAFASHTTKEWLMKDNLPCNAQDCPEYTEKRCKKLLALQVILPEVPIGHLGIGVYQVDTTSFYSIVNINSTIKLLRGLVGRCSMIPLTLTLGPMEVSPPGQKTKIVFIMHVGGFFGLKLAEIARLATLPLAQVLLPAPTEADVEEFYPEEEEGAPAAQEQPTTPAPKDKKTKRPASQDENQARCEAFKTAIEALPSDTQEVAIDWLERVYKTRDPMGLNLAQVTEAAGELSKIIAEYRAWEEEEAQKEREAPTKQGFIDAFNTLVPEAQEVMRQWFLETYGTTDPLDLSEAQIADAGLRFSKLVAEVRAEEPPVGGWEETHSQTLLPPALTPEQIEEMRVKLLRLLIKDCGLNKEQGQEWLKKNLGKEATKDLTVEELVKGIKLLEKSLGLARETPPADFDL